MVPISKKTKIGLIIGAFKPYTKGHHFLITKAAKENDYVHLFISQNDRKRKQEHPVYCEKMNIVWDLYLKNILPTNVIIFKEKNPIISVFNELKKIDSENNLKNIFQFYIGEEEVQRYCLTNEKLNKNYPNLFKNNLLNIVKINRAINNNVSGTLARKGLKNKNFELFSECLPNEISELNKQNIFNLLI